MIVVALTKLNPITIRSIEVSNKEEAYDLYSQNPNYVIAIISNDEVLVMGSKVHNESHYMVLKNNGYIFDGKKVKYLSEDLELLYMGN